MSAGGGGVYGLMICFFLEQAEVWFYGKPRSEFSYKICSHFERGHNAENTASGKPDTTDVNTVFTALIKGRHSLQGQHPSQSA